MNKAFMINEDLIVNELLGSNEECLRKASEQIVAHVLHHIHEHATGDESPKMSDTEMHNLVDTFLKNENNSSVPLPISKKTVRSVYL